MSELDAGERGRSEWEELRLLTAKGAGGLRHLSDDEMIRFVRLYRRASADLAGLSASGVNPQAAGILNEIVGRAYGQLYSSPRRRFGDAFVRMIWMAADTVRRRKAWVLASITLFLVFAFAGAGLLAFVPEARTHLVAPGMDSSFDHWKAGTHPPRTGGESYMATIGYAANNPMVAITSNAASVATAGVFGVYSLWVNGAMLGALALEVARAGHLAFLLLSIFPHGVTEMGGIFVSAGAGFMIGGAIIAPGRRSRSDAMKFAGKDAAVMLATSLVMIFIAAPIEGFFSFNPIFPLWSKGVFGLLMLAVTLSFFTFYGRSGPPKGATEEELRPPKEPD